MGVHMLGCDSGGREGVTERAYDWWRKMRRVAKGRRVRLVKGEGGNVRAPRVRETRPDSTARKDRKGGRGDVPVLILNSNALKDGVSADLTRTDHGGGFVHLPAWLDDQVFEELTAEIRGAKGWERASAGARNEAWDLYAYAKALSLYLIAGLPGKKIDWNRPPRWAGLPDVNSGVRVTGKTKPPQGPEPKSRITKVKHRQPLRPRNTRGRR